MIRTHGVSGDVGTVVHVESPVKTNELSEVGVIGTAEADSEVLSEVTLGVQRKVLELALAELVGVDASSKEGEAGDKVE